MRFDEVLAQSSRTAAFERLNARWRRSQAYTQPAPVTAPAWQTAPTPAPPRQYGRAFIRDACLGHPVTEREKDRLCGWYSWPWRLWSGGLRADTWRWYNEGIDDEWSQYKASCPPDSELATASAPRMWLEGADGTLAIKGGTYRFRVEALDRWKVKVTQMFEF